MSIVSETLPRNGQTASISAPAYPEEARKTRSAASQTLSRLSWLEEGLGLLAIGAWVVLFVFGILIGTAPYRARLAAVGTVSPMDRARLATLETLSPEDRAGLMTLGTLSPSDWARLTALQTLSPVDQNRLVALATALPADQNRQAVLETLFPTDQTRLEVLKALLQTDQSTPTARKPFSEEDWRRLAAMEILPSTNRDRLEVLKKLYPTDWAKPAALGTLYLTDQATLAALKMLAPADWNRLAILRKLSPADRARIEKLGTLTPSDWANMAALETLSPPEILLSITVVFLFYTLSNVAILCCLAAFLGALSRKSRSGRSGLRSEEEARNRYMEAVMRGFFVYIALLGGLLIFSGSQFADMDQERYIRLASMISVFSFLIGHDPRIFETLRSRIDSVLSGPAPKGTK